MCVRVLTLGFVIEYLFGFVAEFLGLCEHEQWLELGSDSKRRSGRCQVYKRRKKSRE